MAERRACEGYGSSPKSHPRSLTLFRESAGQGHSRHFCPQRVPRRHPRHPRFLAKSQVRAILGTKHAIHATQQSRPAPSLEGVCVHESRERRESYEGH